MGRALARALSQPGQQLLWGRHRAGSAPALQAEPSGCFDSFLQMLSRGCQQIRPHQAASGFSREGACLCQEGDPWRDSLCLQGQLGQVGVWGT